MEQPEAVNQEPDEVASEEPPLIAEPVPASVLKTPLEGLESIPQVPKRVIIVGGGVAVVVERQRQRHEQRNYCGIAAID